MSLLSIILRSEISTAACWLFLIVFSFSGCAGPNIAETRKKTFLKTYKSPNHLEWSTIDTVYIIPIVGGNMRIVAKDYGAAAKSGYSTTATTTAAGAVAGGPFGAAMGLATGLGATIGSLFNPPKKDISSEFGTDLSSKIGPWTAKNLFEDLLKTNMCSIGLSSKIEITNLRTQTTNPESPLMALFSSNKQKDSINIRNHSNLLFVLCTIIMEGKEKKSSLYLDLQWYPHDGSISECQILMMKYQIDMMRKNYFHKKPFAIIETPKCMHMHMFPPSQGEFYTYRGPKYSKEKWLGNDAQFFKLEVEKGMKVLIEQFKRDIANYCTKPGTS